MARWLAHFGVGLLVAGMLGVSAPGLAVACACGAMVSPDTDARIADEEALVGMDGRNEVIIMRLNLQSNADNAALIVPTPTPASVTATSPGLFDDLAALSAPRIETRRHWTFRGRMASEAAAPRATPPTVVEQVQLGPLEATTLTGGDVSGVQQWLDSHGYTMRPEVVAQLDPYLRQGWAFVAMRLTSTTRLEGSVSPVRLVFASDKLIYPMRMSAAAKTPQKVVIYTLGQHRMRRTDPDAGKQSVAVDYARSIAGRSSDSVLTQLARDGGGFLTKISVQISDPNSITSDFEFGNAPNDDPYQQVVYRDKDIDITPFLFVAGFLFAVVVAIALGVVLVIVLVRWRSAPK